MKQIFFSFTFITLLVACCPKHDCGSSGYNQISEKGWDNLGMDTIISPPLSPFSRNCIFQDETGKRDTLRQSFSYVVLNVPDPNASPSCSYTCPYWHGESLIQDAIENYPLRFLAGAFEYPDIRIGDLGRIVHKDTLYNYVHQSINYPQVYLYQSDTTYAQHDTTTFKTFYVAPRKGIIRIKLSPTHIWERIN